MSKYKAEPEDGPALTRKLDRGYTKYARLYDLAVKALPIWKKWLNECLPLLRGPRVLEASFGTGYLLTQYAGAFETYGIDYNWRMVETALFNLRKKGLDARLVRASIEDLPFADGYFDTILNTFAFSGYPHADKALLEMKRVLKKDGQIVLLDFDYPEDANRFGTALTQLMSNGGDIIRKMDPIFERHGFQFTKRTIGGWGSVQLYIAKT